MLVPHSLIKLILADVKVIQVLLQMLKVINIRDKENISKISPLSNKGTNYHHTWLRNREVGNKSIPGTNDKVLREMYSIIRPISHWNSFMSSKVAVPGGIFNLEFSPDGVLMVAACEKRSILLFDASTQKYVHSVDNAHDDCVNCVRFLDTRVFATCSDDSTVALWDTRNLKSKIRVLCGHSNWVKNVEYSKDDKLLVTSGFDGSIFTWDINSYTERGLLYKKVFNTNGLMRMRLLPDASKMVICTTGGYLMVVHNLNLETLPTDLLGFSPGMYRLMQTNETIFPVHARFTHLFSHRRKFNRVELIDDFPRGDEAEVISSLQIHPQGWCALSRNITTDERSEWTCVHDIQDYEIIDNVPESCTDYSENMEENSNSSAVTGDDQADRLRPHHSSEVDFSSDDFTSSSSTDIWEVLMSIHESREAGILLGIPPFTNMLSNGIRIIRVSSGIEDPYLYEEEVNSSDTNVSNDDAYQSTSNYSPSSNENTHFGSEHVGSSERMDISGSSTSDNYRNAINREAQTIIIVGPRNAGGNPLQRIVKNKFSKLISPNYQIHKNKSRLTHYIEETNVGKGYIKELSFSQDGRIICSPYSYGVRLLAFNEKCSEMSTCFPNKTPVSLYEIGTSTAHNDIVLCTDRKSVV